MKSVFIRFVVVAGMLAGGLGAARASAATPSFHRDPLVVPDTAKVTVSRETYPGLTNPNPKGWYYKCANVVLAKNGDLVACWQISDDHTSLLTHVMVARSKDKGRTWDGYKVISSANVWEDKAVWVVPQMGVLKDGRILIVCDRGQRGPNQDWPMLAHWQRPGRGMSNHLFWSEDDGATWRGPEQVDDVGGEPSYPLEFSDGTIAFTRTSSAETDLLVNPPLPWGNIYYRNEIAFSDDAGKSWDRTAWLSDDPFYGDCEVGLVELAPKKILAVTRIGLGNGRFGHPSRLIFSEDNGRTWPRAVSAPFYGQRVHIGELRSGKLLATYRNVWGTPGSRALVFDPEKDAGFQPTSYILDESRCELGPDAMTIRTEEGNARAVEFCFQPAEDDKVRVEIHTSLRVEDADANGCALSTGVWIRFLPDRVCLADRPEAGFAVDAREWHDYRIVRERGTVVIHVDGVEKLREPVGDLWVREVRAGNRSSRPAGNAYSGNRAVAHWRSLAVSVHNRRDYPIDWEWTPSRGYPDQFRRDRIVTLDVSSDSGYSSWTQVPDGEIVIVDYTNADLKGFGHGGPPVFIRAYLVRESDLAPAAR